LANVLPSCSSLVEYMVSTKGIIDYLTDAVELFVSKELKIYDDKNVTRFANCIP
jgi:hypothetical protein